MSAAAEAKAAGYGGIAAASRVTKLARSTIGRGLKDLRDPGSLGRKVRRKGGGSPRLATKDILQFPQQLGNARKTKEGGKHPDRDAQFEYINAKVEEFQADDQPVMSIDAKKKELLGVFKNGGSDYSPQGRPIEVNTHDFEDKELGKVVPYGVYDIGANDGYVSLGIDHDTGQFAVNSVRLWLDRIGRARYLGNEPPHDHRRWRRLQWFTPAALELVAATIRRRNRPDHSGMPLSARHFQVKQDRASHVLFHHPELARHASRQTAARASAIHSAMMTSPEASRN